MDKSPDAFRTISEVAEDLDLPQHVLRFWETRFTQIKPMKRGGGRRYYRPQDVELIKGIRHMLYDQGYTIKGVQKLLRENGNHFLVAIGNGDRDALEAIAPRRQADAVPLTADEQPREGESPLLVIHRERQEVDIGTRLVCGHDRRQDHRLPILGEHGAMGLLGKPAGLQRQLAAGEVNLEFSIHLSHT